MTLSREREAELIEQNMPKIYRAVDNYMAKRGGNAGVKIPYDDFVQEVCIAFLRYIRRCKTEDDLKIFPWYDAKNAMCELVLRFQPVKVPIMSRNFSKIIHSIPATVSYDVLVSNGLDVDGMSKHWVPDKDTEIDFNAFMASQSEATQRIAAMCMHGMSQRKIASQFGVARNSIVRKIQKLREQYNQFNEEDSEDE